MRRPWFSSVPSGISTDLIPALPFFIWVRFQLCENRSIVVGSSNRLRWTQPVESATR